MATVLDGEDTEYALIAESSIGVIRLGGFEAARSFYNLSLKKYRRWKELYEVCYLS